jgi:hypothetical protein
VTISPLDAGSKSKSSDAAYFDAFGVGFGTDTYGGV